MAMEEAKVHIDPFKPGVAQVEQVMKALRPLIPIRFEKVRIAVKLSGEDYGRCYEYLNQVGKLSREEWQSNGSWIGVIELPAGLRDDFLSGINEKTKGNVETKILKGSF